MRIHDTRENITRKVLFIYTINNREGGPSSVKNAQRNVITGQCWMSYYKAECRMV